MSATKFIAELERRRLLSDRLMVRLRASLENYSQPLTAEELADFLVNNKHLTPDQAASVLQSLSQTGFKLVDEDALAGETGGESSIFSSHIMSGGVSNFAPSPDRVVGEEEVDDEIRLAPLEDDFSSPPTRRVVEEEALPILSVVPNAEDTAIERAPEPILEPQTSKLIDEESGPDLAAAKRAAD